MKTLQQLLKDYREGSCEFPTYEQLADVVSASETIAYRQQEPVGKFTVVQGKTINDFVRYETNLPDGDYRLFALKAES